MSRRGHMQAKHYNYTLNLLKQVLEPALTSSSWLDSEIADSSYSSDSPNVASGSIQRNLDSLNMNSLNMKF